MIFPCLHPPNRVELGGRQSLAPILAAEHRTGRQLESERRNCRKEAKGRRAPSSKAHPLTYFHSPSRGSRIRNNQNPAGNNIQLPNWVVCVADVSSVSPGGSLLECVFFFLNTKNSSACLVHLPCTASLRTYKSLTHRTAAASWGRSGSAPSGGRMRRLEPFDKISPRASSGMRLSLIHI